ncbi:MAG: NFACT family protein, partial [bacterium]
MALDGIFINKLINELNNLVGSKINKIYQLGSDEFLFNLKGYDTSKLLISTNASNYRIHKTTKTYSTPKQPSSFVMFLRKHLEGGVIKNIYQISLDRIIVLTILKHNELRDIEEKNIIVELVGKASNLILCDKEFKIIDSWKHVINVENDKVIIPKSTYKININKKNIFEETLLNQDLLTKKDFQQQYYGISPLLYEGYINNSNPNEFINKLKDIEITPVTFNINGKDNFYFTNILGCEVNEFNTLSELLDNFFYDKANTSIIKQKTNNIDTTVKKLLERTQRKICSQEQ